MSDVFQRHKEWGRTIEKAHDKGNRWLNDMKSELAELETGMPRLLTNFIVYENGLAGEELSAARIRVRDLREKIALHPLLVDGVIQENGHWQATRLELHKLKAEVDRREKLERELKEGKISPERADLEGLSRVIEQMEAEIDAKIPKFIKVPSTE